MPAIGYVTKLPAGGFKGHIKTLSIRAEIELVPNGAKSSDTQPDYRVVTQGVEIGAGWVRRSESSGNDYVSLGLAAPGSDCTTLVVVCGRAAGWADSGRFVPQPARRLRGRRAGAPAGPLEEREKRGGQGPPRLAFRRTRTPPAASPRRAGSRPGRCSSKAGTPSSAAASSPPSCGRWRPPDSRG